MRSESVVALLTAMAIGIIATETHAQQNMASGITEAKIEFANGGEMILNEFGIDGGPLEAMIGDSQTTIGFERLSKIDVAAVKTGSVETVTLTLTPRKGGPTLTIKRQGWDHVRGVVVRGDVRYGFHTALWMCKAITLSSGSPIPARKYQMESASCTITTTNGTTYKLADIQCYGIGPTDTGYQRGFMGIGSPVKNDIYKEISCMSFAVSNGTVSLQVSQIKNVSKDTLTLVNGSIIALSQSGNTPFGSTISRGSSGENDDPDSLVSLAGWLTNEYVAVESKTIAEIAFGPTFTGRRPRSPETPTKADPIKKFSVTDSKGQTQELENATIVSPYGILTMARIIMNRCYPNWHITGSGPFQSVASADEFLSQIAVRQGGMWRAVNLSQISRWSKEKDGLGTLFLRNGESLPCVSLEIGEIKGNNAWGEVKYSPHSVNSFSVEP